MEPSQSQPSDSFDPNSTDGVTSGQTTSRLMEGLNNLFSAIKIVEKNAGFQELMSVLKDAQSLRSELDSKEVKVKQLEALTAQDRKLFVTSIERTVDEHRNRYLELEGHRDKLAEEAATTKDTVQKQQDACRALEDHKAQMQATIDKLKQDLEGSHNLLRDEKSKSYQLERELQAAKAETARIKTDAKSKEGEIAELKESRKTLGVKFNELRQSSQANAQQLQQLRSLAIELRSEPVATA